MSTFLAKVEFGQHRPTNEDGQSRVGHRAAVMKSVPRFLQGPLRNVMKLGFEGGVGQRESNQTRKRLESFLDVTTHVAAPPSRRWTHFPQQDVIKV